MKGLQRPIKEEIGVEAVEITAESLVLNSVCHPHPDLGPPTATGRAPSGACGEAEEIPAETVADQPQVVEIPTVLTVQAVLVPAIAAGAAGTSTPQI